MTATASKPLTLTTAPHPGHPIDRHVREIEKVCRYNMDCFHTYTGDAGDLVTDVYLAVRAQYDDEAQCGPVRFLVMWVNKTADAECERIIRARLAMPRKDAARVWPGPGTDRGDEETFTDAGVDPWG